MLVFRYDKTFEGLMSAIFDAYSRAEFPAGLIGPEEPEPLFAERVHEVETTGEKSDRVWAGFRRKSLRKSCNIVTHVWLSEKEGSDQLIFRYMRKIFDSNSSEAMNFADEDVLSMQKLAQKVGREVEAVRQFVRFQKADDDTFFAPVSPDYNVLPLSLDYFRDRFADQKWIVYDMRRNYGYYYDLKNVTEIILQDRDSRWEGKLDENLMAEDEKLFQDLWRVYFKALTIKERENKKSQRQHMPRRFWKYITEMQ